MPDLLDILEEIETTERLNGPCPSLFASPTRGVQERVAEFYAWCKAHDSFASYRRSHAWLPEISNTEYQAFVDHLPTRCLPTILRADLCDCNHAGRRCYDVGGLVQRGACYGCIWEGPVRDNTSTAVEDAHDHAWPGWRDLPVVSRPPSDDSRGKARQIKLREQWKADVDAAYPPGWLESGGPIVTERPANARRDVPGGSRHGGYDLAARPGVHC